MVIGYAPDEALLDQCFNATVCAKLLASGFIQNLIPALLFRAVGEPHLFQQSLKYSYANGKIAKYSIAMATPTKTGERISPRPGSGSAPATSRARSPEKSSPTARSTSAAGGPGRGLWRCPGSCSPRSGTRARPMSSTSRRSGRAPARNLSAARPRHRSSGMWSSGTAGTAW